MRNLNFNSEVIEVVNISSILSSMTNLGYGTLTRSRGYDPDNMQFDQLLSMVANSYYSKAREFKSWEDYASMLEDNFDITVYGMTFDNDNTRYSIEKGIKKFFNRYGFGEDSISQPRFDEIISGEESKLTGVSVDFLKSFLGSEGFFTRERRLDLVVLESENGVHILEVNSNNGRLRYSSNNRESEPIKDLDASVFSFGNKDEEIDDDLLRVKSLHVNEYLPLLFAKLINYSESEAYGDIISDRELELVNYAIENYFKDTFNNIMKFMELESTDLYKFSLMNFEMGRRSSEYVNPNMVKDFYELDVLYLDPCDSWKQSQISVSKMLTGYGRKDVFVLMREMEILANLDRDVEKQVLLQLENKDDVFYLTAYDNHNHRLLFHFGIKDRAVFELLWMDSFFETSGALDIDDMSSIDESRIVTAMHMSLSFADYDLQLRNVDLPDFPFKETKFMPIRNTYEQNAISSYIAQKLGLDKESVDSIAMTRVNQYYPDRDDKYDFTEVILELAMRDQNKFIPHTGSISNVSYMKILYRFAQREYPKANEKFGEYDIMTEEEYKFFNQMLIKIVNRNLNISDRTVEEAIRSNVYPLEELRSDLNTSLELFEKIAYLFVKVNENVTGVAYSPYDNYSSKKLEEENRVLPYRLKAMNIMTAASNISYKLTHRFVMKRGIPINISRSNSKLSLDEEIILIVENKK